jgi:hypothetical protein
MEEQRHSSLHAMPLRAFRHPGLSVWQSLVREAFSTDELSQRINANEGTADYCEIVMRRLEERELDLSFEDLEPALLEDHSERGWFRYVSAANHHIAMALFGETPERASRLQARLRRYEEGRGNWHQWKKCLVDYGKYVARVHRGPMYRPPEFDGHLMRDFSVVDGLLSEDREIRVALVGDWGTGEPAAINVLDGILAKDPHFLIHLGDVYFSGTEHESYAGLYDLIRQRKDASSLPVFTLAGNHDYFSGGDGFYQLIDHLNEGAARQAASYFCVRNRHWQLLAMDTGFMDSVPSKGALLKLSTVGFKGFQTDLRDDEFRWHRHQLESTAGRRTILLSHHQLFSAYDAIGVPTSPNSVNINLNRRFSQYFSAQGSQSQVRAWFWAHEHDFVPMSPHYNGLGASACLGHGAIPVDSAKVRRPGSPPYNGRNKYANSLGIDGGGYYNHGFSVLYFRGSQDVEVTHFQVDEHGVILPLGTETGI